MLRINNNVFYIICFQPSLENSLLETTRLVNQVSLITKTQVLVLKYFNPMLRLGLKIIKKYHPGSILSIYLFR
jgi:hypothetical protein